MNSKKLLSLLLAVSLAASLCACGKSAQSNAVPEESAAEEYVYTAEHIRLPEDYSDYVPLAYGKDGIFLTKLVKVGERVPEGERPLHEGQRDIMEPRLYFMDTAGTIMPLEAYSPLSPEYEQAGKSGYMQSSSLNALFENDDGTLTALESVYRSWTDEKDAQLSFGAQDWYLRRLDSAGGALSCARLETAEDSYVYSNYARLDAGGRLVVPIGEDICVYSHTGELACALPFGGYVYSSVRMRDGSIAVLGYDMQGSGSWLTVKRLDADAQTLDIIPLSLPDDCYSLLDGSGDYDFYYTSYSSLYAYRLSDEGAQELLNLLDCDIDSSALLFLRASGDDGFTGMSSGERAERFILTKTPAAELPQRVCLTLATMYADSALTNAVIDFNRASDSCRIELKDYSQYNNSDDWEAGRTKLLTEIMAGSAPDIINTGELPYRRLAARGLLEDLKPYMQADGELCPDDFFQNVMAALEVNDGVYAAVPGFCVQTVVGASSVVGDEPGWTYEDYFAALEAMPEGCEGFDYGISRQDMLEIAVSIELDRFVDWTRGECSFDSGEFVSLLEYAASLPDEADIYSDTAEDRSSAARIAAGKQMLCSAPFSSTDFLIYDYDAMFGGDVTFIGFPTSSGIGTVLTPSEGYAMSSACAEKEAAWQFLRVFLTEEYQVSSWGLPTNKNAFERSLAAAMAVEYEQDANGNYLLDENGERIPVSRGGIYDGISYYPIYATTPRQAEQLRSVIEDAQKFLEFDRSIIDIVLEGAAPFFAGQKSAEDCARLIQSKANIYINEQR